MIKINLFTTLFMANRIQNCIRINRIRPKEKWVLFNTRSQGTYHIYVWFCRIYILNNYYFYITKYQDWGALCAFVSVCISIFLTWTKRASLFPENRFAHQSSVYLRLWMVYIFACRVDVAHINLRSWFKLKPTY